MTAPAPTQVLMMLRKALEPAVIELMMTWEEVKPLVAAATEGGVSGINAGSRHDSTKLRGCLSPSSAQASRRQ